MPSALPRVREPLRRGQIVSFQLTDDSLPPEHVARQLWEMLEALDLLPFYASAKAVEGRAGRRTHSARMKLCLWGYALSRGISSAREISRLCRQDLAFLWITAGQPIDHTILSDFRHQHSEAMDKLLTELLRRLQQQGVELVAGDGVVVAQDGSKMRADAAMGSFRRRAGLQEVLAQAREHRQATEALLEQDEDEPQPGAATAAQVRGAKASEQRCEQALAVVEQLQSQRANASDGTERKHPKASTTDPDARVMRFPHGGYEPGYNVQWAASGNVHGGPVVIVGVQVAQVPSDQGSVLPMVAQIEDRLGRPVARLAVDSNHVSQATLQQANERDVEVISRPPKNWKPSKDKKKKRKPMPR